MLSNILINIIGAESTGKSTLSNTLSIDYDFILVDEYAREYCNNLAHKPNRLDVKKIATKQLEEYDFSSKLKKSIIFDTSIITSIIWLYDKFNVIDLVLHQAFLRQHFDLTLLCYPDIHWVADNLREDAQRQMEIHEMYVDYMDRNLKKYLVVQGEESKRLEIAKKTIDFLI